jgi:hypothetical protein
MQKCLVGIAIAKRIGSVKIRCNLLGVTVEPFFFHRIHKFLKTISSITWTSIQKYPILFHQAFDDLPKQWHDRFLINQVRSNDKVHLSFGQVVSSFQSIDAAVTLSSHSPAFDDLLLLVDGRLLFTSMLYFKFSMVAGL